MSWREWVCTEGQLLLRLHPLVQILTKCRRGRHGKPLLWIEDGLALSPPLRTLLRVQTSMGTSLVPTGGLLLLLLLGVVHTAHVVVEA